jgi:hypothetical protein
MIWPKMMGETHLYNELFQGKKNYTSEPKHFTYDFSRTNTMICSLEKDLKDCH